MKKAAILLIICGLFLIVNGGSQWLGIQKKQHDSMQQASRMTDQKNSQGVSRKEFFAEEGDVIGTLEIPSIGAELPIVEGTDEDNLERGVGHYPGTAFPSMSDQIVLSGHRDTVFRRMGDIRTGDTLVVRMPYGSFSYEMQKSEIVSADDRTVIASTSPDEVLTVITCYPFSYIGNAPDRYVITAIPTK